MPAGRELRAGRESRGLSRWLYYLSSIPTILLGVRPLPRVFAVFLGLNRGKAVLVTLSGGLRFRVRTRMEIWILKESALDRDYERNAVAIEDGWTVVDIGAGLGDFAVRVARERPASRVYAFEPQPDSFALMRENIRENGVSNLFAFPEAVSGKAGTLSLFTVTGLSGQHRTAGAPEEGGEVRVPAITLADCLDRLPGKRCDFLKVDCEGAEYEILFAAPPEALARIRHMALEYHDGITAHRHEDLAAFLERNNFAVRTRTSPAYSDLGFLYASRRSN